MFLKEYPRVITAKGNSLWLKGMCPEYKKEKPYVGSSVKLQRIKMEALIMKNLWAFLLPFLMKNSPANMERPPMPTVIKLR